jgi:MFS family permease
LKGNPHLNNVQRLTLISALVFGAVGINAPLLSLYLEELGARFDFISLILTTVAATALLSHYAWGHISDRLGRRKPLVTAGLLAPAATFFLLSRVTNPTAAWAIRIFEAVAMAAYSTTSLALMGDLLSGGGKRGRRMGLYRGIGSFAFAVGATFGGRLADQFSISYSMTVAAGLYLLAALVAATIDEAPANQPTGTPESEPVAATAPNSANRDRLPWPFLAGVICWVTALSASASMWPNYMASLGYNKTTTSSLWGLAALTEAPAMHLAGHLSDVIGRAPLLMAGGLGIAIVMIGYITLAQFLPALFGIQITRGFGYASYTSSAMTFAAELGDERVRGSNSGTFNAATGGGQLIGSMIGGTLVQFLGFQFMFGVCATIAVGSALCFWLLRHQTKRLAVGEPSRQS